MWESENITSQTRYVGQFGQTCTTYKHKGMDVSEDEAKEISRKEFEGYNVPQRPMRSLTDI